MPIRILDQILFSLSHIRDTRPTAVLLQPTRQTGWNIRIGESRVSCNVFDTELVVSVVHAGDRREGYAAEARPSPISVGQVDDSSRVFQGGLLLTDLSHASAVVGHGEHREPAGA